MALALAGHGEPLQVAVASNFQGALASLKADYPGAVVATYGSSGLLYAQLVQGRRFDVFLSADAARPRALVNQDRAHSPVTYATGRLVLVVNHGKPGMDWLAADKRVALANPQTAPYGRAAHQALEALGARPRLINALNVAQAFHFAASGAVDGAFVALAQVTAERIAEERYWLLPNRLHTPIEQVAVVMHGEREAEAQAWLDDLLGHHAQSLIRTAGYRASADVASVRN
jgi:molybdate transport system substrate-binding protein